MASCVVESVACVHCLVSAEFDSQIAAFRVLFAMGELTTNTLGL